MGTDEHGCWSLAPIAPVVGTRQYYHEDSLVVQTESEVAQGCVRTSDCMPTDPDCAEVIRVVEGIGGRVPMRMRFQPRFGYAAGAARLHCRGNVWVAEAASGSGDAGGAIAFGASVACRAEADTITAEFDTAGESATFAMTFAADGMPPEPPMDAARARDSCIAWWRDWSTRCEYRGRWRDHVVRSLVTLKGLTYSPTGGIVAAATASLPEIVGGSRNWDYRYCWLRDATFTLYAMLTSGYRDEARHWHDWLVDAVRREPLTMHVLYRVDGGTDLDERELPWLPGHLGSRPSLGAYPGR